MLQKYGHPRAADELQRPMASTLYL